MISTGVASWWHYLSCTLTDTAVGHDKAVFISRWEEQLTVLCAKANKMLMRTVQQNVFLILNRVPILFVTHPKLIRPPIPVMTHYLDQKVMKVHG